MEVAIVEILALRLGAMLYLQHIKGFSDRAGSPLAPFGPAALARNLRKISSIAGVHQNAR
ncbi:hypothetical protein C8255_07460 [filamentous cyanobacterium CCP3]|nr:hypothetical protein C8255_07460 [filamentous cyanobacterium CCP3]